MKIVIKYTILAELLQEMIKPIHGKMFPDTPPVRSDLETATLVYIDGVVPLQWVPKPDRTAKYDLHWLVRFLPIPCS